MTSPARILGVLALALPLLFCSRLAAADESDATACVPAAVREWDPSPTTLARDLLARARALDEAALADERSAATIATDLPAKRAAAKVARDQADRASGPDKVALEASAEDLETEVAISEVETVTKREAAASRRLRARELRARALRLVQGASALLPRSRAHQSDIF